VKETDCRLVVILTIAPSAVAQRNEGRGPAATRYFFLDRCGGGVQLAEGFGAGPDWPAGPSLNSMIISCMS